MIGMQYRLFVILLGSYWLYRCYRLRCKEVYIVLIVAIVLYGSLFFRVNQFLQSPLIESTHYVRGILYPDSIRDDGEYITGKLWQPHCHDALIRFKKTKKGSFARPVIISGISQCNNGEQRRNPTCYSDRMMLLEHRCHQRFFLKEATIRETRAIPLPIRISWWRYRCVTYFSKRYPPLLAQYVLSLIFGYRTDSFKQSALTYQQLGMIHLFSLSGFHVSLLLLLWRYFLLRFGFPRDGLFWMELLGLIIYFILTGCLISVFRSGVQYALKLMRDQYWLEWNEFDIWGLSVVIGLCFYPILFVTAAGMLTYGLSLALLIGRQMIQDTSFIGLFQQTLWMTWVSLPIISYYFHEVSIIGIWINTISLFLFSYLVPLLLICVVLALVTPQWTGCFVFVDSALQLMEKIFFWCSNTMHSTIITGSFSLLAIVLWSMSLFTWHTHYVKYITYGAALCAIFGKQWLNPYTKVSFIDVGQGDSTLIQLAHHKGSYLIDTGGRLSFGTHSSKMKSNASYTVIPYIKSEGIRRLDAIFLTHADADHMGDIVEVAQQLYPKVIYYPSGCEQKPSFRRKMEQLKWCHWQPIEAPKEYRIGELSLNLLWPVERGTGDNDHSLVFDAFINQKHFILTGDLGIEGERELMKRYPSLKADILKVGHHGSRHSTSVSWLEQLQPKIGIISCGKHNRFSHPHQEVVHHLQQENVKILRTDDHGQIQFVFWKHRLQSIKIMH